jgi:glycosyltransferase involved in cell wall biosynthesis
MRLCFITLKNKFYLGNDILISSNFLWYEESKILGFRFEEFEKIVLVGFRGNELFDGYVYPKGIKNKIFVIGPNFRVEKRYVIDRLVNIFLTLKEIWKNRQILKDVDLVFAPFFEYLFFEFLLLRFICPNAKFILYVMGDYPELNYRKKGNLIYKFFLLLSLYFSIKLSSESWFISEYLFKKYGKKHSNKRIAVVRSSKIKYTDILVTHKKQLSSPCNLVYVGRISEDKNTMMLPLILKEAVKKEKLNVRLKIVGDGPLKGLLENTFNYLKLSSLVDFYGWIRDKEKLFSILDESHILILTSLSEGTPLVFFESFARGLVVITTHFPGAEEIVEDGVNGYLVKCKSNDFPVGEFVEKIKLLITNPELYEQISSNNIEKVKYWTIEKLGEEYRRRVKNLLELK